MPLPRIRSGRESNVAAPLRTRWNDSAERGGGAQQDDGVLHAAPQKGEVPRLVPDAVLLLVRGVVLLVHDDEAHGREGQNTAERAPTQTDPRRRESPSIEDRSAADSALWRTATPSRTGSGPCRAAAG